MPQEHGGAGSAEATRGSEGEGGKGQRVGVASAGEQREEVRLWKHAYIHGEELSFVRVAPEGAHGCAGILAHISHRLALARC